MNKILRRVLTLVTSFALIFSGIEYTAPVKVLAAESASMTTESIDDPVENTVNADVSFETFATHKLLTANGTKNDPINATTTFNANNIPDSGIFTVYYGKYGEKPVINFVGKGSQTAWKSDDKVYQIDKGNATRNGGPSGWESIQFEPQGDGTFCFKSSANDRYVTIIDDNLGVSDFKERSKVSPNEKFIIHTKTAPKTAKKVTLSQIAGDSVTVSWQGVSECLYSGYEVLYSTSENGNYKSAGVTGDLKMKVENLSLNTQYYFKVRTITNTVGGAYADSKIAYCTTLKSLKPKKPTKLSVEQVNNGLKVSWAASAGSVGYAVYRSDSRFGKYTFIGNTNTTSFVDTNPNAAKFKNYYQIKGTSEDDESEFSNPTSLEISMFGDGAYIFNDTDDKAAVNKVINDIFEQQHYSQFGDNRYALMFKSGDYTGFDVVQIGYYTQILGLGTDPTKVKLNNVKTPAALSNNNATCNFWVGIENVSIMDLDHNGDAYFSFQWGVSQAAPARRLYVQRNASFDWYYGWASGGYVADCWFDQGAGSYSQQQYYYRNDNIKGGVYGVNWNNVVQGCEGVTKNNSSDNTGKPWTNAVNLKSNLGYTNWDQRGCSTVINKTEKIREKPFLFFDEAQQKYKVFVPSMRYNVSGTSWEQDRMGEGTTLDVESSFYIARSDKDNADTINAELKKGKNILFSPGVYHVNKPIQVNNPNTILLGIGEASIIPDNEEAAIKTADVSGISICGLILDAGNHSKTLLTVGEEGCNAGHSANPIVLQDVIYRVGGTGNLGRCDSCLVINSNDVIVDHTWIWRADHGEHTGWKENTAKNGMIVNGDNVIAYGLFVEHFQEYDIIWRGENGKTFFLQNEKCYDPKNQAEWMSHDGTKKGYAAYKVTDNVTKHYAIGLGVYDVFINTDGASIFLDNAIELPNTPGVLIENACIVEIANGSGPQVGINHIINNTTAGIKTGAGAGGGYAIQRLLSYENSQSVSLPDYYADQNNVQKQEQVGETPSIDNKSEKDIKKEEFKEDTSSKPIWEMTDADYADPDRNTSGGKDDNNDDKGNGGNGGNNTGNGGNNGGSGTNNGGSGTTTVKVGSKFTVGKYTYKVTKLDAKTAEVSLIRVTKNAAKKLKKAKIGAKVKYAGKSFKIKSIGKKAFAKCKKLKSLKVKGKTLAKVAKNAFAKKIRKKLKISAKKKVKKIILKALKRKK